MERGRLTVPDTIATPSPRPHHTLATHAPHHLHTLAPSLFTTSPHPLHTMAPTLFTPAAHPLHTAPTRVGLSPWTRIRPGLLSRVAPPASQKYETHPISSNIHHISLRAISNPPIHASSHSRVSNHPDHNSRSGPHPSRPQVAVPGRLGAARGGRGPPLRAAARGGAARGAARGRQRAQCDRGAARSVRTSHAPDGRAAPVELRIRARTRRGAKHAGREPRPTETGERRRGAHVHTAASQTAPGPTGRARMLIFGATFWGDF